jgi:hypothetical protein
VVNRNSGDPIMAENPGERADDNKKAQSDSAAQDGSEAMSNLPMVVAPKLGAGEEAVDETTHETAEEPATEAAASATPAHSTRFLVLAASVAFAAAFGSFVGSVSGSGLAQFLYPATPAGNAQNVNEAMRTMNRELAELQAIKANLDNAVRGTTSQIAKISDRLDRLDQRPATAAETTGTIPASAPAPAEPAKIVDRILPNWIVQDVQNGRALVESRYGGIFDVGAGSVLPGVGRVETVKRQDGQWIVITERGTITSGR